VYRKSFEVVAVVVVEGNSILDVVELVSRLSDTPRRGWCGLWERDGDDELPTPCCDESVEVLDVSRELVPWVRCSLSFWSWEGFVVDVVTPPPPPLPPPLLPPPLGPCDGALEVTAGVVALELSETSVMEMRGWFAAYSSRTLVLYLQQTRMDGYMDRRPKLVG